MRSTPRRLARRRSPRLIYVANVVSVGRAETVALYPVWLPFVLFGVAVAVTHIPALRGWLNKRSLLWAEYLVLAGGAVGLIGLTAQAQRASSGIALNRSQAHYKAVRDSAAALAASCGRELGPSDGLPTGVAWLDPEYEMTGWWCKAVRDSLKVENPQIKQLSHRWDHHRPAGPRRPIPYRDDLVRRLRQVDSAAAAVRHYEESAGKDYWYEKVLAVLAPLFVPVALAIAMARAFAELRGQRRRRRNA